MNPLPIRWTNFEINTGSAYRHPALLGPVTTSPTISHRYAYPMVGTGVKARFRLVDRPRTTDNYGVLRVTVRNAVAGDCLNGGHARFGYANRAACEAATT